MDLVVKKPQGIAVLIVGLAALAAGPESAEAAPPSLRGAPTSHAAIETVPRSSGTIRNEREFTRLDLRAPSDVTMPARTTAEFEPRATTGSQPSGLGALPFPRRSSRNEPFAGRPAPASPIEENSPSVRDSGLASAGLKMNSMSRAEELTRRFRREGLPLARLMQTRSATVSLGLNARGKPGIWLIQKLP